METRSEGEDRDAVAARSGIDVHVVGVDFGTLSGRAVVVRARDGAELGSAVCEYPHAVIERTLPATGEPLAPAWALQDPDDYREVLRVAVPEAIRIAGVDPCTVVGIGTDITASTPMPVCRDATPLCDVAGYRERPHAYPKLWKHHAAQTQADRVTQLAAERGEPWLAYTRLGRNVYAVGGSEQSALLMGLPVARTKIAVYTISGFCSAPGGILRSFYTLSGFGSLAVGMELDAIAAVVIGGTLLVGGTGYLAGSVLGVMVLGLIQTLISFDGTLSSWWTKIVIGVPLLTIILLQRLVFARGKTGGVMHGTAT